MAKLSIDEIRRRFATSKAFNVIFDAFQQALDQKIDDLQLYRQLFWNKFLSADEVCMFGQKLATEFPHLAYEIYLWLASVFAVNYSHFDNYELAMAYFTKASSVKPAENTPYLDAADCYDPDLNIPPVTTLIRFLKDGATHVPDPHPLYERLCYLYDLTGNDEMTKYYRMKLDSGSAGASDLPPS